MQHVACSMKHEACSMRLVAKNNKQKGFVYVQKVWFNKIIFGINR